ncbi:MAG TPA: UdgX family uracil-DNA binding protein [Acidimicrobiales bacterium]|nr:UdgX family uracil-DNA binding protein [Acidimicrobiales bacterium]
MTSSAWDLVPNDPDLASLRRAAADCTACGLYRDATQTVFGSGARDAALMLVGEQPGDKEDLAGEPFVGPAGKVLDQALDEAGIDRGRVYITNAVKHFKFTRRGKVRLHKKPSADEIAACRPWLETELSVLRPDVVVCLGATAAQALLGPSFRVTRDRGRFVDWPYEPRVTATVHPSSILRAPDEGTRQAELARFTDDLRFVARALGDGGRSR